MQPKAYIVGAGPGDPELLTLKALRAIQTADVVLYDRLVSPGVLALVPPETTRIFVGKQTGFHSLPQDEINELLVSLVRSGRSVARLKGGDPFIFGRGSEEAVFLAEHGIPFEVIPGITSASGASASACIPLTHRGLALGVRFVTGHSCNDSLPDLDWASLADPKTTLVIYMGLNQGAVIAQHLLRAGLPSNMPAAAIENATLPNERVLMTTLGELGGDLVRERFSPPTLIIIGQTVQLRSRLCRQDAAWEYATTI